MKRILIIILSLLIFYKCAPKGEYPDVPYDIIKPEKMIEIMVDVHIVESYFVSSGIDKDTLLNIPRSYYEKVMQSHGIDLETFDKSLKYYLNHAHIFYEMYGEVIEKLSEKEAILREKQEEVNE